MGKARCTLSNPSASLIDFSLLVDLSRMPAEWWAEADTDDATRGRAYKGDGTTRLAIDWIEFDRVAKTGFIRINWVGVLASTGTQQLVIEPPLASRATVSSAEPYGQYEAYNSLWVGYWPGGAGIDRVSGVASTPSGITPEDSSGPLGKATQYNGNGYALLNKNITNQDSMTALAWINNTSPYDEWRSIFSSSKSYGANPYEDMRFQLWHNQTVNFRLSDGNHLSNLARPIGWGFVSAALTWDKNGAGFYKPISIAFNVNGTTQIVTGTEFWGCTTDAIVLGGNIPYNGPPTGSYIGYLSQAQVHNTARAQEWTAYERQQTSNQSGTFGTWTYEGDGPTPHDLIAVGITTGTPVLGTPALGQTHALQAQALTTAPAILGTPSIGQTHAQQAQGITTGTPVLGTPALSSQSSQLVAVGITTGPAVLGTPALGQSHALIAVGIMTGAAVLGRPALINGIGYLGEVIRGSVSITTRIQSTTTASQGTTGAGEVTAKISAAVSITTKINAEVSV